MTRTFLLTLLASLLLALTLGSTGAEQPKAKPGRFVGLKYDDPRETGFLKAVLSSLNLAYTVTVTAGGELVEWASTNTLQEIEIENRVSQFSFITMNCKGMHPPLPSQPALKSHSCQR
jgi:hypothetical protein